MDDPDDAALNLDHALLRIEQKYIENGSRIEALIREHSISPAMATSLMTDAEYTFDICRNLVNMSKLMFSTSGSSTLYTGGGVELDKEEIAEILQQD